MKIDLPTVEHLHGQATNDELLMIKGSYQSKIERLEKLNRFLPGQKEAMQAYIGQIDKALNTPRKN